jgi:hypothetical protein
MSQFFGTNPASRPPSGPKEGDWRRELPKDWRSALGLAQPAPAPAEEAAPEGDPQPEPDRG